MNRENGRRFRGDFDEQLKNLASDIKVVSEEHSLFSGTQRMKMGTLSILLILQFI